MLTVVYCTRKSKPEHKEHLMKTSGLHTKLEVIEMINDGESLTKAYNRGLKQATNDIVVFCHDDITLETKQWGRKLLKQFDKNPEYGIIGVAGSKYMSTTGRWWDDRSSMYGRVQHTSGGKSWLSAYSPDQNDRLEEVLNVDGLFFAIHKDRIETGFDEKVEGFHFYDVDFSFRNYMDGVKVGVTTKLRVNHQSMGETNDEWEENRKVFAKENADILPQRIKETYEHKKLKVLIGCLNFQGLTGSEISTLETAKGLAKQNCDVSVVSGNVSPKYAKICNKLGIKTYLMREPPGFKMGDGKWVINTQEGQQPSKPNTLYNVKAEIFDVIHANHTPITEQLLRLYPQAKFVNIVRSEVIDLENPIVDERIKQYIAIRPNIKEYIMDNYDIPDDKINVIYNPFDKDRFKQTLTDSGYDKKITLFVGTMDYLREGVIRDLIVKCKEADKLLWLVGKDTMGYASIMGEENEHVSYYPPTDNIEEFFHKCDETAGIFLGRTTIEGYLCGKPAIIYKVDKAGGVISSEYTEVPEDLSIFDIDNIISKIKKVYIDVANTI